MRRTVLGGGHLPRSRAARYWAALFLVWMLAGCATSTHGQSLPGWSAGAPRFNPSPASVAPPRRLWAMSDGPAVQGYNVPGRAPSSQMPWEFFLGNAAHRLIAYMYGVNHPGSVVHYNTDTLKTILTQAGLGNPSRLRPEERNLRPDITDVTALAVFEIKPWNEQGLQEGRLEVQMYLAALNRAVAPEWSFSAGTNFQGEVLIHFAAGQYIWRLEWKTAEPGVVPYRWTRSQQRFESEAAAYNAGQWVDLTEGELRQYGGWVSQAVEGLVSRRERLATFSGAVGVVIKVIGDTATAFFSGVILRQVASGTGAQQPPTQGGAQVISFPARTPPSSLPARVPAATGTALPR